MNDGFADRVDAGRQLARALDAYRDDPDVTVLGLPRGGVPVAAEVATALSAPLDVFVVRKLGVPGHEELAMGAVASGGVRVLNAEIVRAAGVDDAVITSVTDRERAAVAARENAFRSGRPPLHLGGRKVIVVDDGLATGATMRAAVQAIRQLEPSRVVVGVPVGAPETCAVLSKEADEVVCLVRPERFYAVGTWYDDFSATSDDEVRDLLLR